MSNWQTKLSNAGYGIAMRALFHSAFSPRAMRRNFEFFAAAPRERLQRKYPNVRFGDLQAGPIVAESICAVAEPQCSILYLHGGGYVFGSIATYRQRAIKLSYRCRAQVVMPEYRLAPEHPFPAALVDATNAWRRIAAMNPERPVLVAGDSAGGGLALALTAALRDAGERLPAGAIVLSPWTDLALTGPSLQANRNKDCWLRRDQLLHWSSLYRGAQAATHPLISPLYADLQGFPPLLVLVGDQEILLDDALRLAARARQAGVQVTEVVGRDMQHDWPLTLPWLPASRDAWTAIAHFAAACTGDVEHKAVA